jgi:hypothetical protein
LENDKHKIGMNKTIHQCFLLVIDKLSTFTVILKPESLLPYQNGFHKYNNFFKVKKKWQHRGKMNGSKQQEM